MTVLGLLAFYHPKRESDFPRMSLKNVLWACDPIGSVLFIVATTLMLLALDWGGGAYPWNDKHVVAPLTIGCVCLVLFALYGQSFAENDSSRKLTSRQNGRAEMMVLLLMSSSEMVRISRSPSSRLLLKAGSSTAPLIASLLW